MKNFLLYILLASPILSWGQIQNTQKTRGLAHPTLITTTNSNTKSIKPSTKDLYASLVGTFQVEISKPNYQVLYTESLLNMIQSSRKVSETVRFTWDDYTTIIVLPLTPSQDSNSEPSQN